tara:strand:- start:3597 stop:3827 length:231 start_codon:yes stop_codon:yes gene_type:complete
LHQLIIFDIPALHCDGCIDSLKSVLENFPGISLVAGDLESLTLSVSYDESSITPEAIKLQLAAVGYVVAGTQFPSN